jgi:hypothetical protein
VRTVKSHPMVAHVGGFGVRLAHGLILGSVGAARPRPVFPTERRIVRLHECRTPNPTPRAIAPVVCVTPLPHVRAHGFAVCDVDWAVVLQPCAEAAILVAAFACSQNGYLSSRGGCQNRWHLLVNCDHGDSTSSRFDSPACPTNPGAAGRGRGFGVGGGPGAGEAPLRPRSAANNCEVAATRTW